MRAVIQRVSRASVVVEGEAVGSIGPGLLALVCVEKGDGGAERAWMAGKIATLRVFPDERERMDRSVLDLTEAGVADAGVLAISNFTLAADGRKGRRPSFDRAAPPELAAPEFDSFVADLRARGLRVETGVFGAHMDVELVNDGPVTIVLQSPDRGG